MLAYDGDPEHALDVPCLHGLHLSEHQQRRRRPRQGQEAALRTERAGLPTTMSEAYQARVLAHMLRAPQQAT